ncbi:MAG: DNA-binding response regulator [Thermoleophilia bacterium]|nr:MAG: DNA-binding response regulator [Thermoleophilia bacterium]
MTLLALIVDDETPARSELRHLLGGIDGVEVAGEAASAHEALVLAERMAYDVVFLDISMPGGAGGIETAKKLAALPNRPTVVFVTAHDDRAIQAFSVEAVDYLLKPVRQDRLVTAVRRVAAMRAGSAPDEADELRIPVKGAEGETLLVDPAAIAYAEADRDHSILALVDGRRLACTRSLRALEDQLPTTFLRIHRSQLVNLSQVAALEPVGEGRVQARLCDPGGTTLAVARRQTRALRTALGLR